MDLHGTLCDVILSKMVMAFEVCFYGFPVMQTRTCRSTILCSWIVEMGPYFSCHRTCVSVAGGSYNYAAREN